MVSVIIPNYNHSLFLKQRIESVLSQTYQNYELLILDDCSKDSSKAIIEQYRNHPKVSQIVYNEVNSGSTFQQWQKGVKLAKGKFIWFAESDDYADPSFLEKLEPLLNGNDKIGLTFCNSHVVDKEGSITSNTNNWTSHYAAKQGADKTTLFHGLQFCLDHMFYLCRIPNASAVLFRREPVLNNLEWIDPKLRNSGDWKLWLNICLHYDVIWLNEDLNYFRVHGANVTRSLQLLKVEAHAILKELIHKKHRYYRVYESLAAWSFRSASWTKDFRINFTNSRQYFQNNLSVLSILYLFVYLNKKFLLSAKKLLIKN